MPTSHCYKPKQEVKMNVQQVQELRRSSAASPIQGKRFAGPSIDEWEDEDS